MRELALAELREFSSEFLTDESRKFVLHELVAPSIRQEELAYLRDSVKYLSEILPNFEEDAARLKRSKMKGLAEKAEDKYRFALATVAGLRRIIEREKGKEFPNSS